MFSKLLSVTNSLALTQVVSDATHYSTNFNSLIDLVFLSSPNDLLFCETVPPLSNSDHLGLHFKISIPKSKRNSTKCGRKVWRYAYADFNLANEMIADIDWEILLSSTNINECWSIWRDQFLQIMDICIPKVTLKGRKNLPWLTKPVIQAMRQRNRTFRAAKRSKSLADWEKYKIVRNKVTAMLRRNKRQYFYKLKFSSHKDFWKAVKVIKKQDTVIPVLWDGQSPAATNSAKAELLNTYFYDSFNHSYPPISNPAPLNPENCPPDLLCSEEQITDMLCSLDTSKSTGLDGVSAVMLKSTAASIAPIVL